ncbi:MAG TPA: glutaredoxin family protein [Vicinamibacteria bacterium]|nr:glutaredoxin family protein [Vicinamibacteria bacterium]
MEAAPAVLTVLGKPDCHLCHVMADVARRAAAGLHATVVERDVREDPDLHARYRDDIPVLLVDGREAARHRVTEPELRSRLLALGVT